MCYYQTAHDSLHYTTRHVHCVQRVLYAHSKYVHMGMYITHYVHSTPELICSGQWIWSNSHSLCQLRGIAESSLCIWKDGGGGGRERERKRERGGGGGRERERERKREGGGGREGERK